MTPSYRQDRKTRNSGQRRAKSLPAGFLAASSAVLALCAGTGAQAADWHNPYSGTPYTVSIANSSTAFNSVHSFNGPGVQLNGFGLHQTGLAGPVTWQHVSATFLADPGHVFTSMDMTFYPFYWQNNSYLGGHWFLAQWSVSAGTGETASFRQGAGPFDENLNCQDPRCYAFDQTGTSGVVKKSDYYWGSGGTSTFQGLPIMSAAGISFANVSQFTVEMDVVGLAAGEFGMSLGISAYMTSAPIAAPVPEPETYAMLLAGLGLLGFVARRRKQKEAAAA